MLKKTRDRNGSFKFHYLFFVGATYGAAQKANAQDVVVMKTEAIDANEGKASFKPKVYYGTASYYADIFNGRETANGDTYYHNVPSAACNVLPLGTWIRVTNLKNNRSVIVRVNDRLHPRMKRIVDLNKDSAVKLGYVSKGLEEVKVEVLGIKKAKS